MAVTGTRALHFLHSMATKKIDLSADTVKVLLMRSGFVFSPVNHKTLLNIKTNSTAISLTASNSLSKFTRGAGSFITDGFVVGNRITTNSAHAANQGPFLISVLSATVMTVTNMAGADVTLDVATEPETITITSDDELDTGFGYTKNTKTTGVITVTEDDTNIRVDITFPTVTWTATGGSIGPTPGAILMDDTSSDDTIIGYINYGAEVTTTDGNNHSISNGIIRLTAPL